MGLGPEDGPDDRDAEMFEVGAQIRVDFCAMWTARLCPWTSYATLRFSTNWVGYARAVTPIVIQAGALRTLIAEKTERQINS